MKRLARHATAAVLAVASTFSLPAQAAETVDLFYHAIIGSLDYGQMGYTDENGQWVSVVGQKILGARAEVRFDPVAARDVKVFFMAMVVPVTGARSEYFTVDASQLVPLGEGRFYADITSNLFNGTVRDGRFSVEAHGLKPNGEQVALHGRLEPATGFHFTVTKP